MRKCFSNWWQLQSMSKQWNIISNVLSMPLHCYLCSIFTYFDCTFITVQCISIHLSLVILLDRICMPICVYVCVRVFVIKFLLSFDKTSFISISCFSLKRNSIDIYRDTSTYNVPHTTQQIEMKHFSGGYHHFAIFECLNETKTVIRMCNHRLLSVFSREIKRKTVMNSFRVTCETGDG